jgi:hypothetical protein
LRFKDFITRQRAGIFIVGLVTFTILIATAQLMGFATLWGELLVDLSGSAITVIFTALIIDYLGVREESNKTKNAAGLAEDEIKATCFRVEWRMARMFGMERRQSDRSNISNRKEAKDFLDTVSTDVTAYLGTHSMVDDHTPLDPSVLPKYSERLQFAKTELEQTLLLYEYAMSYSLRERVLNLRTELQIADNILGFIDYTEQLNEANISLIRILSQSIYGAIEQVLEHDSRIELGTPIHAKESSQLT